MISLDAGLTSAEHWVRAAYSSEVPSLSEYAQATFHQPLHDWQRDHLIPLLASLATTKGRRVLIHAPPQFGKSVWVSQRFPAWLMGVDPTNRVRLACYNVTKAAQFGAVIANLMQDEKFANYFGPAARISSGAGAQEFSTAARQSINDGQPSFKALGLESGFTGSGADTLIMDDPYASATHAISEAYEAALERFWTGTALPRLTEETNVVAMFHRYHSGDFAQRRFAEGGWEYIRFPALADLNEDGADPTGRQFGEPLSPMRSRAYLEKLREDDPETFAGQFQGLPKEATGGLFLEEYFQPWEGEVPELRRWISGWDLATSVKTSGDYVAKVTLGKDDDGTIIIRHVDRFRAEWPDACDEIIKTAQGDGPQVAVVVESFGFQLSAVQTLARAECFERVEEQGKTDIQAFVDRENKRPERWVRAPLMASHQKGDKKEKASAHAWHAKRGRLKLVVPKGMPVDWRESERQGNHQKDWRINYIREHLVFDGNGLVHDDQVDATSAAWDVASRIVGGRIAPKKILSTRSQAFIDELVRRA